YFLSYTGLIFDLGVGFLLLFRRTRLFAMACMMIFHATNHFLIFDDIGWFPLLGITTALIFLEPNWPERFWRWIKKTNPRKIEEPLRTLPLKSLASWTASLVVIYLTI